MSEAFVIIKAVLKALFLVRCVSDPSASFFLLPSIFYGTWPKSHLPLCLLGSMLVIMWVGLIPFPSDRGEVCRNWDNSCIGIVNNSSAPLLTLQGEKKRTRKKVCGRQVLTRTKQQEWWQGVCLLLDFRRESDSMKLKVQQGDKLHLVTFGWEWNFSALALEPTWFWEISFSGSVRAAPDSDCIS